MYRESTQHVDSYYAASCAAQIPTYTPLDGELSCDVVVIGAGFSGLHTALRLAEAGKRVVVLEASRVAWAASGRNGGQAIMGWSCDIASIESALGYEKTRKLWQSMRWATQELRELPIRHGFDCDYRPGHLWTAVLPRRVAMLHEWQEEAAQKWGYDRLEFVSREQLPQWIDSPRYQAGLFDPEAGHLNPLKLALGLAGALTRAGGQIFERSRVLGYQRNGNGFKVKTERGSVQAEQMVLACNTYLDQLEPKVSRRILPVGTYQIATEPLGAERVQALLPRNSCVSDNQFVLDYFRLTPDHRMLFGGGCTYMGGLPKDMARATRPFLLRVFPQLADVKIDYAWGGHIDVTRYRTPDVGRENGLYWLQGFSGHGLLPTLAAARAVSDAILGYGDELSLYQGIKNPAFPFGETLAGPLEAAGKAWYRLRDFI